MLSKRLSLFDACATAYCTHKKDKKDEKKLANCNAHLIILRIGEMPVGEVKLSAYKLFGSLDPAVLPFCFFEIVELVTRMKD